MASSLVFKLKSSTAIDVVTFDGRSILARDAKVLISTKIGCTDAEIDVSRDGVTLSGDEELLAFSQVEVVRKLVQQRGKGLSQIQKEQKQQEDARRMLSGSGAAAGAMAAPGSTEEERIAALSDMIGRENANARAARGGGAPMRGGRGGFTGGPQRAPPPGYVCHACGKQGHYIEHCPESGRTDGKRFALPVGIAESKLERVDASDPTAKFVTEDGHWVRRRVDGEAFVSAAVADDSKAPDELRCTACSKPFTDAVKLGCCGKQLCSKCVDGLMDAAGDDPPACPACDEPVIVDEVEPDDELRRRVQAWRDEARGKRPRD